MDQDNSAERVDADATDDEPLAKVDARGARILVIDDSAAVRSMVESVLTESSLDAVVATVADGAAGLRRVLAEPFDCVICDVAMPAMDGITFLRTVRPRRSRLELPVILLTVLEALPEKVIGFRAGASDFIVKPCEPDELVARVETQVQLKRLGEQNAALTRRLRLLVDTDALTSLANRRAFMRAMKSELARFTREQKPFTLLLLDIDHFKQVNDVHGHQTGDTVLVNVAAQLKAGARPYDVVARVGGEEFGLLLPGADGAVGAKVAERIRAAIEESGTKGELAPAVTVSVGVACITHTERAVDDLYRTADERLYGAKFSGRNQVIAG